MTTGRTSLILAVLAALLAAGCASAPRLTGVHSGTNLVFGRNLDDNRVAQALTNRSDWPSVQIGYRFDNPTLFVDDTFDNEYFYERNGDTYYRLRQTSESGVLVR